MVAAMMVLLERDFSGNARNSYVIQSWCNYRLFTLSLPITVYIFRLDFMIILSKST